ncbi:siderophore biosynthesis protein [Nocardia sp. MH4]|uniref:ATP-grasp domain-containing protein n=1 Tax=Nocardia TaxID=1817 RepID=UPI001C4F5AE3|nr:ATP-grasp domain-containing protein [Nocardia sp. MH4]MBW0272567.1 siderophore biosynthesis protein [Nocardia sp. MH4]
MQLYLLALNPTDSVSDGYLPAATALGLDVTILSDDPEPHQARHPGVDAVRCDVRDPETVIAAIAAGPAPAAVFTNSDHLQTPAAIAAAYFGLPGKDWRATLRVNNKAEMRRRLDAAGLGGVWSAELGPLQDPATLADLAVPLPCVVKPREGVASEDVYLVHDVEELVLRGKHIRERRPGVPLLVEEYLPGQLFTVETLGDGRRRHVLGGFRTTLTAPPQFIELRHTFVGAHPPHILGQVCDQLDALGVGFGACHTEFVVDQGRARLIEVNYRTIGDQCDLALRDVVGIDLFEHVLRTHLGEPLAADLGLRTGFGARVDHVCAADSGTLHAAPAALTHVVDGVDLTYRPLRAIGSHHRLTLTNRDYVGVLRTVGPDSATVDRVADHFLTEQRWEVHP